MDHRITQCPRCGTSFRVTEAHLAVAAGAVRCGSCLHIFNARDHWADAKPAATPEPEKPIAQKKIEEIEIDDDALFDDDSPLFNDDDDEPETKKTKGGIIFNAAEDDFEVIDDGGPEKLSESFLDINSWEEESGHSFRNERNTNADEEEEPSEAAWAQKLLEDDEKTDIAINTPARSEVFGEFDEFDNALDSVPEIDESEAPPKQDYSSEFSAEFLNIDAGDDRPKREAAKTATTNSTLDIADESSEPVAATSSTDSGQPLFALRDLEQEPIRLHQFVHESRWPKILWGVALVAVLLLSGWQYVYFNLKDLSHGSLRPWLQQACNVLDCVLPPQFDVAQVRTNSLIVRSHPTQRGALAVDAIITNQADFPQPYPVLQLQFSDLNGAPVAGRRFQPSEYLSGELTGARLMPIRQPVHIALEIVDPGSRAVNYQLSVVSPDLTE